MHKHSQAGYLRSGPGASGRRCRCGQYLSYIAVKLLLISSAVVGAAVYADQHAPVSRWYGDWIEVAPTEVGYDADRLEAAIDDVGKMRGVQGLLLVRHGYLVAERYWRGGAPDIPHNLKSASKSVMSALTGIAIERGYVGLDQPIVELLPGFDAAEDPAKRNITVRHLLTMTSGLQSQSYQAYNQWVVRPDWINFVLAEPLASKPGTLYGYNTANTHLLSAILARQTGQSTRAFAQSQLFDPMGITIHDWLTDPEGIHIGGNNLWLLPRDLAKFGQLYLDRGRWGDRQLVTADWVAASTRPGGKTAHETYGDYGYLWWTPNGDGSFAAVGYGGQYILVSPRDDTVIVITSTLVSKGDHWENKLFRLLRQGIAGSLINRQLPATVVTTAQAELRSAARSISDPRMVIPEGERLELFARDGDWVRVRIHGQEGWLAADQVRIEAPVGTIDTAQSSSEPQPETTGVGSVIEQQLRGDAVAIPESRLDSLRERAKALDEIAHEPAPLPRYRISGVVNFRRSPNLLGALIGQLQPDTEFQALERSEAWLMARIDGEQGWVHSDFAEIVEQPSPKVQREKIAAEIGALVSAIEQLDRPQGTDAPRPRTDQLLDSARKKLFTTEAELNQLRGEYQRLQGRLHDAQKLLAETQQNSADERDQLAKLLAQFRQDAGVLAAQLDKLRDDRKRQQKILADITAESDTRAQQLSMANASIDELRQALEQAQGAGESLSNQAAELRNDKQQLLQRVGQLTTLERKSAEELASTQQQLAELLGAAEQAASQRQALEEQLQGVTLRNVELETQLNSAQQRNQGLAGEIAQVLQAIESERQSIAELRQADIKRSKALIDSRDEVTQLLAAIEDERRATRALATEAGDLRQQLEARQEQLMALDETDRQRQERLAAAEAEIEQLRGALVQARSERLAATEQLENTLGEKQTLQQELSQQRALEQQWVSALQETEKNSADLATRLEEGERDLQKLSAELTALHAQNETGQQDLAAMSGTVEEQRKQLEVSGTRIAGLEAQLSTLNEQRKEAQDLNAGLEQALTQVWLTHAMAVGDLERERAGATRLQARLTELEKDNAGMTKKVEAGEARVAMLQRDLSAIEVTRQSLQADIDRLQDQSAAQQKHLSEASRENESSRSRISSLEQTLKQQQTGNERLQAMVEQQRLAGESQAQLLAKLRDADARRTTELDDARTRIAELEEQLQQGSADQQQLLADLQQAREQGQSKQQQLVQQQAESAAQTEALQTAQDEIASLQGMLKESAKEREAMEQEMTSAQAQQQAENKRLEDLLAQARTAAAQGSEQSEKQKAEIARAEEALRKDRATIVALGEELQRLRDETATQQQQLAGLQNIKQQLDDLQRAADVGEQDKGMLLGKIERMQEAERQLQQRMAVLAESNEQRTSELAAVEAELASLRRAAEVQQAEERVLRSTLADLRQQNRGQLAKLSQERDSALSEIARLEQLLAQEQMVSTQLQPGRIEQQEAGLIEQRELLASSQAATRSVYSDTPIQSGDSASAMNQPVAESAATKALSPARSEMSAESATAPILGVEEFVLDWAAVWSRQDVDGYLSHYAADFQPDDGADRVQWAEQRRQRLTRPKLIRVQVSELRVEPMDGQHVQVTFEQAYRANHYRDRVTKVLDLRLEDGNWKILREVSR